MIPDEWILICKYYRYSGPGKVRISFPVPGLSKDLVEDTYGAPRPGNRRHQGIDLHYFRGMPIISAIDGILISNSRNTLGGNSLKILGIDNRLYYCAHLDSLIDFSPGAKINQNDTIGFIGNTGNAITTLPHLHFEIMEIQWLFPLIIHNVNPYPEL